MDDKLLLRLGAAVDATFPLGNGETQPSWRQFATQGTSDPTVLMSRDPRVGERLTPVFFVTCRDEPATVDFMRSIYERSDQLAGYAQGLTDADGFKVVIVPPMFQVVSTVAFAERLTALCRSEEAIQPMAWSSEGCEVVIGQYGYLFRQVRGDDQTLRTVRAEVGAGRPGPWTSGAIAGEPEGSSLILEVDHKVLADTLAPLISEANIFAARAPLSSKYPVEYEPNAYRWRLADLAVEILRDHPDGLSASELADQIGHREAAQGTLIVIDVPRQQVRTLENVVPGYSGRLIAALNKAKK